MSAQDSGKAIPFWVTFVSGGVSGTVGAVITNPLEVVKTRLQSSMYHQVVTDGATLSLRTSPMRASWMHIVETVNSMQGIYRTEGLPALWRGMGATIVGVMPSRAIYFSTYTKSKHLLAGLNGGREDSLVHLVSALNAGVVTATLTNPIWLIKTKLQLQSSQLAEQGKLPVYRNSFHCLQVVMRTEGIRGLYKGLTASYLGTMEGTVQWVLYEKLKRAVASYRYSIDPSIPSPAMSHRLTWADYFVTAASAKLVAAILAYPHEVLRTRLREDNGKYRGLVQTALRIAKEEGLGGFYGGMTAHLMRVVPNSAIMFFCYECLLHGYNRLSSSS